MGIVEKIRQMRNRARKLRLKYRKKGDTRMADSFAGQEIALNQVLSHETRIKQLEQVFGKIDSWIDAYKRDKTPPPNYPANVWRAVRGQALVILRDLRSIKRGKTKRRARQRELR